MECKIKLCEIRLIELQRVKIFDGNEKRQHGIFMEVNVMDRIIRFDNEFQKVSEKRK